MKKTLFFFLLLLLPCVGIQADKAPFSIDQTHIYEGMSRAYLQGYRPSASGDTLTVVLPLQSDAISGKVQAVLTPENPDVFPAKPQSLTTSAVKRSYLFGREKVESFRILFKLSLYEERADGEYPFQITVTGADGEGNPVSQTFDMEAVIRGGTASEIPRVEIERLPESNEPLQAGENALITLNLRNTSKIRAVEDLSLTFSDASGDIWPDRTNTLYVGRIPSGKAARLSLPVRVINKAAEQPHALEMTLHYTYGAGQKVESTVRYTIDIRQEARLNYSEAALPASVEQGDTVAFGMNLMNMGKSTLNNVLLSFEIPGLADGGSVLAGAIPSGESKSASANFQVGKDFIGDVNGFIHISYEDAYGECYEISLPLQTTIREKTVPVYAVETATEEQKAMPAWIVYAVIAVCGVGMTLQGVRYRKKIREMEERHL